MHRTRLEFEFQTSLDAPLTRRDFSSLKSPATKVDYRDFLIRFAHAEGYVIEGGIYDRNGAPDVVFLPESLEHCKTRTTPRPCTYVDGNVGPDGYGIPLGALAHALGLQAPWEAKPTRKEDEETTMWPADPEVEAAMLKALSFQEPDLKLKVHMVWNNDKLRRDWLTNKLQRLRCKIHEQGRTAVYLMHGLPYNVPTYARVKLPPVRGAPTKVEDFIKLYKEGNNDKGPWYKKEHAAWAFASVPKVLISCPEFDDLVPRKWREQQQLKGVKEGGHGNSSRGTAAGEQQQGNSSRGTAAGEQQQGNSSMGTAAGEQQHGNSSRGTAAGEQQQGNSSRGTAAWDQQQRNSSMGTAAGEQQHVNSSRGTAAVEQQHGNSSRGTAAGEQQQGNSSRGTAAGEQQQGNSSRGTAACEQHQGRRWREQQQPRGVWKGMEGTAASNGV
ncbi:unnamed protein product [Closterium sp. Yama58-4]|nr:unnamed protein product [Closterium sp. Yama58-4]